MNQLFVNIKRLLKFKKMKQRDLAKQLNVDEVTVSRWMIGVNEPPLRKVKEIASILNVSMSELFSANPTDLMEEKELSLDDLCSFERIECNGKEMFIVEEREEFPTFRQILDKCIGKGKWKLGSFTIIGESYLRGLVFNFGNYCDNKVRVVGYTQGFA